jgi:hypothetical protein
LSYKTDILSLESGFRKLKGRPEHALRGQQQRDTWQELSNDIVEEVQERHGGSCGAIQFPEVGENSLRRVRHYHESVIQDV